MNFFKQLGILAALEKAEQDRKAAKVDDAYTPLIKLAQWLDRVSAWLRQPRKAKEQEKP